MSHRLNGVPFSSWLHGCPGPVKRPGIVRGELRHGKDPATTRLGPSRRMRRLIASLFFLTDPFTEGRHRHAYDDAADAAPRPVAARRSCRRHRGPGPATPAGDDAGRG